MDRREFDYKRRTGSVKAATNVFGEKTLDGSPSVRSNQMDIPEKSSLRARELHMSRRDTNRYKESRRVADLVKTQAESELSIARKTVEDFASRIEESNSKAKAKIRDVESLRKSSMSEENALDVRSMESNQYAEVRRELALVKRELSKLKLDMASILEEKLRAEKEIDTSSMKMRSNSSSVEALRKEIEEVNEEEVLVELARIEALKEYGEVKAEREKEEKKFSTIMEEKMKKMKYMIEEIDRCKELENKLAVTLHDVNLLQNELINVKDMDKRAHGNQSLKHKEGNFRRGEELECSPLLQPITEELEAARKQLASIKDKGIQLMSLMDAIRNELKHVREEKGKVRKAEEKLELTFQNLNSKLLRAKSKLESISAVEEKAKGIASNLVLTLEQLKTEAEAAKKDNELVTQETANIKEEIQKTESEIDLTEEKLQATMQELNAVKSSESLAFENLKSLIDNTMQARASASQHGFSITISKLEYEYLTGRAVRAEEIADKKVAAAQSWIEALKASEKEILMKIEMAYDEIREARVEEEKEVFRTKRARSMKRRVQKPERTPEGENWQPGPARKSTTPSNRAKYRKSASPAAGMTRSTSFAIKKKTKVFPNFAKFFSGKRI